MKSLLTALAFLAIAPIAYAQSVDTKSDSYICYHGAADDPRTNAACDRVQAEANQPVAQVAPPPKANPNAAQNAGVPAVTPNSSSPSEAKTETPAAQAAPTDVGETPYNGEGNAEQASADQGGSDVSVHGSWLAGLGVLAIVALAFAGFALLAIHFIPTIIAIARHKRNAVWIFVVNLFLGWTVIGWVAALVWSLMPEPT